MANSETAGAAAPLALPSRAGMSSDTKWIIGTIVPAILVVAGLLSAQIAGVNTRIDDMNASVNARFSDMNASVNARFSDVNARIDDLQADIRELRALVIEALKRPEPAD